jgi:hypothetical protein
MQSYIRVANASTRQGHGVQDHIFKLLEHPKKDKEGLYIVVDGSSHPNLRNGRVRLYIDSPTAYKPIDSAEAERIVRTSESEDQVRSDEEIANDIRETFSILAEMTKAVATNVVKGLVVSGPAGIGKSHTVETTLLRNLSMLSLLREGQPQYEMISGGMTAAVLYEKLWNYKDEGQVLVFDDCDGILYDEDGLNILKAALDSKKTRRISWNSRSYYLEKNDIPASFEYKGGIIFITNVDFHNVRSPRISNHLEAITSRCHYMALGINTPREKIIHINSVIEHHDMLREYQFTDEEKNEVIRYIDMNAAKLREISLRTVLKVADLRKAVPHKWALFADKNVLKS